MEVKITKEYKQALEIIINEGHNVFVTGQAGTGKSTLLKVLCDNYHGEIMIVAPTGQAAVNVGGATIHSAFRINPYKPDPRTIAPNLADPVILALRYVNLLIIDEISMVRADLLDCVDQVLKKVRGSIKPFGGVQVVFFGDVFQLKPVIKKEEMDYFFSHYQSPYFFHSHVIIEQSFDYFELTETFRQKDPRFIQILNAIRIGDLYEEDIDELNTRVLEEGESVPENTPTLCTTNALADTINRERLESLGGKSVMFYAHKTGQTKNEDYPVPEVIELKVGAQIVMAKNDQAKRWVNGTMGMVTSLNGDMPLVRLEDGSEMFIQPEVWETIQYRYDPQHKRIVTDVVGTYSQIPIKLAWAITIHKSQGQTYKRVHIDLGSGSFAHGQTYVGLTRATSLEGITLQRPLQEKDFIYDPVIMKYFSELEPGENAAQEGVQ